MSTASVGIEGQCKAVTDAQVRKNGIKKMLSNLSSILMVDPTVTADNLVVG